MPSVDRRSGIAAIWLILAIPVFAAVLIYVLNIGFLWIARAELENAAVAGALAGVESHCRHDKHKKGKHKHDQHKHDAKNEKQARETAEQFIEANCVLHHPIRIGNDSHKKVKSSNCRARIAFGHVDHRVFHVKHSSKRDCACLVELSKTLDGPLSWFSGRMTIHARAVAVPSGKHGVPKLVDIDKVKTD